MAFTLDPEKRLLDGFDRACKGRSRQKVLFRLMKMYAEGEIEIDWS